VSRPDAAGLGGTQLRQVGVSAVAGNMFGAMARIPAFIPKGKAT